MAIDKHNAAPTVGGFQFQIAAAIFFAFKNIKKLQKIKVEGDEDIEILLDDGLRHLVQVKFASNIWDNTNNNMKAKKAFQSLADADASEVSKLIYVSNMSSPVKADLPEFSDACNATELQYNDLSPQTRKSIDAIINSKGIDIAKSKLWIAKIPFYGQDEDQRFKSVRGMISDATSEIGSIVILNSHKRILDRFYNLLNQTGTTKDRKKVLSKKDFCGHIILIELESANGELSNGYPDMNIPETEYYEAYEEYRRMIESTIPYSTCSKIYSLYVTAQKPKLSAFVNQHGEELCKYFLDTGSPTEHDKKYVYVSQILSFAILKRWSTIEKISKAFNMGGAGV